MLYVASFCLRFPIRCYFTRTVSIFSSTENWVSIKLFHHNPERVFFITHFSTKMSQCSCEPAAFTHLLFISKKMPTYNGEFWCLCACLTVESFFPAFPSSMQQQSHEATSAGSDINTCSPCTPDRRGLTYWCWALACSSFHPHSPKVWRITCACVIFRVFPAPSPLFPIIIITTSTLYHYAAFQVTSVQCFYFPVLI